MRLAIGITLAVIIAVVGLALLAPALTAVAQPTCAQAASVNINPGVTGLNVRATPVSGTVLATIGEQTGVRVLATDPESCWYKISTAKGDGWITNSTKFVTVAALVGPGATPTRPVAPSATPLVINFVCPKACEGQVVIQELP